MQPCWFVHLKTQRKQTESSTRNSPCSSSGKGQVITLGTAKTGEYLNMELWQIDHPLGSLSHGKNTLGKTCYSSDSSNRYFEVMLAVTVQKFMQITKSSSLKELQAGVMLLRLFPKCILQARLSKRAFSWPHPSLWHARASTKTQACLCHSLQETPVPRS